MSFHNNNHSRDAQLNHFSDYQLVLNNFNQIKQAHFFINYSNILPNDLIILNNILFDSIEKLDLMSLHFIKKNREKLSESLNNKFENMEKLHYLLMENICEFNQINKTILESQINTPNNYSYLYIISKYKLILYQIIGNIKRLIAYADILKERL